MLSLIQKYIQIPSTVELENDLLVTHRLYHTRCHKTSRYCIILSTLSVKFPLFFYRLSWLFFNWHSFTIHHVDQIIVHVFALAATVIFLPAFHLTNVHNVEIQYIVNQLCKMVLISLTLNGINLSIKFPICGKLSMFELFVYGLSLNFLILVIEITTLPFAISYEPIQWILKSTSILSKLFAAVFYFVDWMYAAVTVLSSLLLLIIIAEGILNYSSKIHFYKSSDSTLIRLKFRHCYKRYRSMQILVVMTNSVILEFEKVLIFVGVLLASSVGYITLKMFSLLNIFVDLLGPATTILCFVMALLLTHLADSPFIITTVFTVLLLRF